MIAIVNDATIIPDYASVVMRIPRTNITLETDPIIVVVRFAIDVVSERSCGTVRIEHARLIIGGIFDSGHVLPASEETADLIADGIHGGGGGGGGGCHGGILSDVARGARSPTEQLNYSTCAGDPQSYIQKK